MPPLRLAACSGCGKSTSSSRGKTVQQRVFDAGVGSFYGKKACGRKAKVLYMTSMAPTRTRLVNVRMLDAEVTMLAELAELEGVSQSEWVRNVIRREHTLMFREKPSPKRRKR